MSDISQAFVVAKDTVIPCHDRQSAECVADDLYWSKGGEARVTETAFPMEFMRAANREMARRFPWWHPKRWALFLGL